MKKFLRPTKVTWIVLALYFAPYFLDAVGYNLEDLGVIQYIFYPLYFIFLPFYIFPGIYESTMGFHMTDLLDFRFLLLVIFVWLGPLYLFASAISRGFYWIKQNRRTPALWEKGKYFKLLMGLLILLVLFFSLAFMGIIK